MMTRPAFCVLVLLPVLHVGAYTDSLDTVEKDIQTYLNDLALVYNCSFSVAATGPALGDTLTVASTDITTDTKFAWGSITKMWTGASIMQLVASGKLSLDEPFHSYVDAQFAAMKKINFPGMNFSKARDLWGAEVEQVTIRDLIHMQSGIPDFDTATSGDKDPFRATVYANPSVPFLEPLLMSVPWVATHNLTSKPGDGFHYSSTNFGLLGLILANHAGIADYRDFNQSAFIPDTLAHVVGRIDWAQRGSPRDHGVVPGYDRTDYNGQDPKTGGINVVSVEGVFSGWSASDFCGPPSVVAELGYALWGNSSELVPREYRDMMVPMPLNRTFYGFASMNVGLIGTTGIEGDLGVTYGHLGATYGYDSIYGYNPTLDMGIAVATSMETETQAHPSDAFCKVYRRVKNYLMKEPVENCTFTPSPYGFGGTCSCKPADVIVVV